MGKVALMRKNRRAVPAILPREPLTRKARAAISEYATIRARDLPIHGLMVRYVLDAERMRRADLYAWLEARGYRWLPKYGIWEKPARNGN
jgi:hypothetical protein